MKRSEMVDKIWKHIENVECDYDIYMTKYDANELLTLLEKEGMLPPTHPTKKYEAIELTPTGTTNYYTKRFNEWEPENE